MRPNYECMLALSCLYFACSCEQPFGVTASERARHYRIGAIKCVAYMYEEHFLSRNEPLPPKFQIGGRGVLLEGVNVAWMNPSSPKQIVSYDHFYYSPKGEMIDADGNPIYLAITLPDQSNVLLTAGPNFHKLDRKRGKDRPSLVKMKPGWERLYEGFRVGPNLKPKP